jgi:CTP:molybdopterin cytidylyltransferase MocA
VTGPAILIPAAGSASRMGGRDKLTEAVEGQPLLRRQARLALGTGAPVLVTLPQGWPAREAALAGLRGVETARLADAAEGMAASLRAGAGWAAGLGAGALMVLLADMPDLGAGDLEKLLHAHATEPETVWRATDDTGRPGHPVILPARLFARLGALTGDAGARPVLTGERIGRVALPGRRATTDLDTPADWAAWRAGRRR